MPALFTLFLAFCVVVLSQLAEGSGLVRVRPGTEAADQLSKISMAEEYVKATFEGDKEFREWLEEKVVKNLAHQC